jgi:hypothetical protein
MRKREAAVRLTIDTVVTGSVVLASRAVAGARKTRATF